MVEPGPNSHDTVGGDGSVECRSLWITGMIEPKFP